MMRHCMVRMLRHHARDVFFAIVVALILSLYLSCQSGRMTGLRLLAKDEAVVMETNSKNDRTMLHPHQTLVAKASRRTLNGTEGGGIGMVDSQGYGNILEGMELVDGDAAEEARRRTEKNMLESDREGDGESSALYAHLQQLEDAAIARFRDAAKVAMVRGEDSVIQRDLPLYRRALEKRGFRVEVDGGKKQVPGWETGKEAESAGNHTTTGDWEDWLILLCLALGDADEMGCLRKTSLPKLADRQKPSENQTKRMLLVNRIPGLRNILWRKDAFCYTMNEARRIPTLRRNQLAPLCWVMPAQFDDFMLTANALGTDVRWVFKSPSPGGVIQVLQPHRDRDFSRIKQYRSQRAVVQQYFPNPLLIFGSPVNIRAYVLVTSLDPLRAYVHSQGLVFFRQDYQKGFTKIPSRAWSLAQFRQYLVQSFGSQVAQTAFRNMETVIVETLLVAEPSLVADFAQYSHPWEDPYRCENCFQLLGFDIIFNSTLHPIVVEVTGQPHLQRSDAGQQWPSNSLKETTVEETIALLFSTKRASRDVARALESLPQVGIQKFGCGNETELCLTDADLSFLLNARRERLTMGSFRQLYPSSEMQKYTQLLQELEHLLTSKLRFKRAQPRPHLQGGVGVDSPSPSHPITTTRHSTNKLHPILVTLEKLYLEEERGAYPDNYGGAGGASEARAGGGEVKLDDVTKGNEGMASNNLIKNFFGLQPVPADSAEKEPHCSDDEDAMPYLAMLHTYPSLDVTFDLRTMDYFTEVSYDEIMIQVGAVALSCDCEARLEDKYGVSRPSNFTLGLGDNRINIYVVDITHSEPWVLSTYTLHIRRRQYEESDRPSLDLDQRHAVCTLVEDCELPFLPSHSCGLRLLPEVNWSEVISKATDLPSCDSGDAPGQWLVPCESCSDRRSCDWESAKWQPHECQHKELSQADIQECLAGKKIFFIGDSTNRGIMYYLMERANSSLYEWDKTHDTKLYANLNSGRTAVSFSYYPQFWLPSAERPVFDSTLYHLLRGADEGGVSLTNDSQTVVVVGGVHWLAVHHLNVLQQVLERLGLTGVQKVVKGLGAGFHQPVDGIHCLTLAEQRKVYLHNRGVRDHAVHLGYDFVDTFNMTMARYGDFLEGKCACHFHKVEETDTNQTQEGSLPIKKAPRGRGLGQTERRYHVTGSINAAYSEILLGQICGKGRR